MPLKRSDAHQPSIEWDIYTVRFPLTDGNENIIWGEVSDLALRERAFRDELKNDLEKRALFDHYRLMLEGLASELFDEGRYRNKHGRTVVRVPNGRL
jgi:hypothetical protein